MPTTSFLSSLSSPALLRCRGPFDWPSGSVYEMEALGVVLADVLRWLGDVLLHRSCFSCAEVFYSDPLLIPSCSF